MSNESECKREEHNKAGRGDGEGEQEGKRIEYACACMLKSLRRSLAAEFRKRGKR